MAYDDDRTKDNPVTESTADGDGTGDGTGDGEETAVRGSADPGRKFREMEVSEEEQREIAEERERRLDPANRPENAEVDNTNRTFEDGEFKD